MPPPAHTIAVIDFETTGLSPAQGARATEIAAVLLRDGEVVGRYQSLMNSGAWVPPFIEQLTGISNRMLERAPPAEQVMREVGEVTRGCALVAHNASFDRSFWQAERRRAGLLGSDAGRDADIDADSDSEGDTDDDGPDFGCTLLLSRRVYPQSRDHRLGTLAAMHGIRATGRAHRALADAEMAAQLWLQIGRDVEQRWAPAGGASFELLSRLQRCPRAQLDGLMQRLGARERR